MSVGGVAGGSADGGRGARWGRGKVLVVAGAVVLGAVAGVGAGYGVQAGRAATPLPALLGDAPAYPLSAMQPVPSAQGSPADWNGRRTLLQELLPVPAGSQLFQPDGWLTFSQWQDRQERFYSDADAKADGYRRAAERGWSAGSRFTDVMLAQFDQTPTRNGAQNALDRSIDAFSLTDSRYSTTFVGSESGRIVDLPERVDLGEGDHGEYVAVGYAMHGDTYVELTVVDDKHPIPLADVEELMVRQLARL